jgi:hypothetical protein
MNDVAVATPASRSTSGFPADFHSWIVPAALGAVMAVMYVNWAVNWWRIANSGFDGWGIGDWLLSYDGGFVRRGLFGSLVLGLTPEGTSIVSSVAAAQIAMMGILFALLYWLYLRTSRSMTWAIVLLSPATLMYFTIAIANQQAGPRKELLVMIALALTALGFQRRSWHLWSLGGLIVFTVATWSHEASALVLPAFLYLVFIGSGGRSSSNVTWQRVLIVGYTVIAASAVVLALLFPGNAEIQQGICDAWASRGIPAECQGQALGALTLTTEGALEVFATQLFPRYWGYLPVVALAALPLYAVRFLPRHWKATLVILAFLLPLFYIAWDYGRWIYLAAMTLSILALALASNPKAPEPMKVPLVGILAFCLLWGFPGYSNEPPVLYDGWLVDWLRDHVPTAWF